MTHPLSKFLFKGTFANYDLNVITVNYNTSEMIRHRGASLSKQQTAGLLTCHGTHGQDLLDTYVSSSLPYYAHVHTSRQ